MRGTIWESAMLAAHHKLDNLVVIVDQNNSSERALSTGDLRKKFEAFDWNCCTIYGHENTWRSFETKTPVCFIANTVKANGVPFMQENSWHNKKITKEDYDKAINI